MRKIALVSCVSKKQTSLMPAKDLNCSDWFIKVSKYVQIIADQWFILSAKHGLVHPDEMIAPYDKTLNKMKADERREWARKFFAIRESSFM